MTAVDLAATDNSHALCTALRAHGVCHDDLLDAFDTVRGWTVLRFTWRDITDNPATVIAIIRQTLSDDQ